MILSMTGYGDASAEVDGVAYTLELRSLNNRYFKAAIKLPDGFGILEPEVESLLRSKLGRGSISLALRARHSQPQLGYEIDRPLATLYLAQIRELFSDLSGTTVDLANILHLPGVCREPEPLEVSREHRWALVEKLALEAIDKLTRMRAEEGRALREALLAHCEEVRRHAAEIALKAPGVVEGYHRRLRNRVNALLNEANLELAQDDLMREVAVFAERCDISEEIARLSSHLDQFKLMCDSSELAGRKLDFLAQEMLREANTIGSKANDAAIALHVVEIKGLIDRLKEQVQNVE